MLNEELLERLGLDYLRSAATGPGACVGNTRLQGSGPRFQSRSPIDGSVLSELASIEAAELDDVVERAQQAFLQWRTVPAPLRGELVRVMGNIARDRKEDLAALLTMEAGKIVEESLGEVQELIDICDFAVGLSRQLHGLTIASERPGHRMMEQWHPMGVVGVITAFNFPMAVWAWNTMIALVCGDTVIWKPSEKTPLCALACHQLLVDALKQLPDLPSDLSSVVQGERELGKVLVENSRLPLISATGSIAMGRDVAARVGARLGRSLLELGGNNAAIVAASADRELALPGIVFAAVGTTGQRCTTLRRLIVHEDIADDMLARLQSAYATIRIGDPREAGVLCGPLIDAAAYDGMVTSLEVAQEQGGRLLCGGDRISDGVPEGGVYVSPAIIEIDSDAAVVQQETFAPLLYVHRYRELDEAIAIQNGVPQGLSSAIFTESMREAERFLSPAGSDCGIANVNIGTSGAEIGGAFGGEKETGGGRESGSDSWKAYMRRSTNTINYSDALPLAQGIRFDLS